MSRNETLHGVLYDLDRLQKQDASLAERQALLDEERKALAPEIARLNGEARMAFKILKPGTVVRMDDGHFQLDPETRRIVRVDVEFAIQIAMPGEESSAAEQEQAARFARFDEAANSIEVGIPDDELSFAPAT